MTSLVQYDRLCAALAEATRVDLVTPVLESLEHLKLHARRVQDQTLLANASELQMRAERRLGELLKAAKAAGQLKDGVGKRKANGSGENHLATLDEIGVGKKLSVRAQQRAALSGTAFEATVTAARERIIAGKARIVEADLPAGARAIMSGRQEPDDSLDFFPTPPFATRALLQHALPHLGVTEITSAWEPAAGEGHISAVLREAGFDVYATDIHDYRTGALDQLCDFLADDYAANVAPGRSDWVITNPPFGDKTIGFVKRALEVADVGVAMFVRLQWLEGIERYEEIFRDRPPTLVAIFAERVPLCKGRWNPDGKTATAYCWLVWLKGELPRAPFWFPPGCRERLTRGTDRARFAAPPAAAPEPESTAIPPESPQPAQRNEKHDSHLPRAPAALAEVDAAAVGENVAPAAAVEAGPVHVSASPSDAMPDIPNYLKRGHPDCVVKRAPQ